MKTETNVAEGASSPNGFRWLAVATCVATFALIVLGGVVRATGSGDACPDWPRCQGELIPPLERDILIEFSHRLLASVVGLLVLAMAVVAWRSPRQSTLILLGAPAALPRGAAGRTEGRKMSFTPSGGATGGSGSAGAGRQYVEIDIDGTTFKVLHDGTG